MTPNERDASASSGGRSSLRPAVFFAFVAVLAALAAAARVPHLVEPSVIGDEVFTRDVVAAPLAEGLRIVVDDAVHPPLHSLVLEPWAALFGHTVHGLRAFSWLAGVVSVVLAALLARRALGSDAGALLAAALVAVNDAQAFYGHTARAYAMYALVVLLVLLAAARCVERGADGRRVVAFGVAALALVYTHYVGWLFLVALLVGEWLAAPARDARWLTYAVAAVGVAFLPWAVTVALVLKGRGLDPNLGWMDRPTWQHPRWIYEQFAGVPEGAIAPVAALFAFALLATGALRAWRSRRAPATPEGRVLALVLATAVLPPFLLCALAQDPVRLPIWGTRHLLPGQAPFAIVLAAGVLALGRFGAAASIAAGVAIVGAGAFALGQGLATPRVVPYADAARELAETRPAEEPLFVASPHTLGLPLSYHGGLPRGLPRPPEPADAPDALWLAYRPGQAPEAALADAFAAADFAVTSERDYGRRAGDPNRMRVVRLARGVER